MSRGGLGLMKFERVIQMAALKTNVAISKSRDEVLQEVRRKRKLENYFVKCAARLQVTRPQSLEECEELKRRLREEDTDDWEERVIQGEGVRTFRSDKLGNKWISNPNLISGPSYLTALKLRTNTFGTRQVVGQVNRGANVLCRRCHAQVETLGHILGICVHTKPARIRRHNEIRDLVAEKVSKRHHVMVESTQEVDGKLLRPDIIILTPEGPIIADVTVVYEKGNYIKYAAVKIEMYQRLADKLTREAGSDSKGKVVAIVVGCRGAMPRKTANALLKLGLSKGDLLTISMIALRTSFKTPTGFIDYNQQVE